MRTERRRGAGTRRQGVGGSLLVLCACESHLGCEPVLRSAQGQLELRDPDTIAGVCTPLREAGPLSAGVRLCPQVDCNPEVSGCTINDGEDRLGTEDVTDCFVATVVGPASLLDGCLNALGPGDITWHFTPRPCPANALGFEPIPDSLEFTAVENPSLQAYLDVPGDALARTSLHPGDTGAFPDDAQLHRGEVVHVLADHPVDLAVVLTHPAHDAPVAWNPAAALLDIRTSGGENAPYVWRPEGVLSLTLPANREVTVTVSWQGVSIPAGRVRAVEAESLTELEVVVGYLPPERDGGSHRVPIGARAIVRLADGTPVYGAPVQWSVARGSFALWRDEDEAWGPDYVALMDEHGQGCHAPATETRTYEGTVVAEFGDLMGTVRIAWEEPGGGLSGLFEGREYEPSALCVGPGFESSGCGCHSGEGSRASWMALLLLGLGFTCRSRR